MGQKRIRSILGNYLSLTPNLIITHTKLDLVILVHSVMVVVVVVISRVLENPQVKSDKQWAHFSHSFCIGLDMIDSLQVLMTLTNQFRNRRSHKLCANSHTWGIN